MELVNYIAWNEQYQNSKGKLLVCRIQAYYIVNCQYVQ